MNRESPSVGKCPPKKRQKLAPPPKKAESSDEDFEDINFEGDSKRAEPWVERFRPKRKEDLVVHKKKVEEVLSWLKSAEAGTLVVTGPPGSGKLSAILVLSKELFISTLEWITPPASEFDPNNPSLYSNQLTYFEEFALRASRYSSLLAPSHKRIAIVKDIPSVFIRDNSLFHDFLRNYSNMNASRFIFILSDDSLSRALFPETLKYELNISTINFNSFTQRTINSVLTNIIKKVGNINLSSSAVSEVSQLADGDLRNAVTTLHFMAEGVKPEKQKNSKKSAVFKKPERIQSLPQVNIDVNIDLFRGLGRVLYAKRDPQGNLSHKPLEVSSFFNDCSNKFVSMLQENYLGILSNIKDIKAASSYLSTSDIFLNDFVDFKTSQEYGVAIAVSGLMNNNLNPIKKFQKFNGSSSYKTNSLLAKYRSTLKNIFPQENETDVLVDTLSYLNKIPYCKNIVQDSVLKELVVYR